MSRHTSHRDSTTEAGATAGLAVAEHVLCKMLFQFEISFALPSFLPPSSLPPSSPSSPSPLHIKLSPSFPEITSTATSVNTCSLHLPQPPPPGNPSAYHCISSQLNRLEYDTLKYYVHSTLEIERSVYGEERLSAVIFISKHI